MPRKQQTTEDAFAELRATLRTIFEQPLLRILEALDRTLRRWPWLYRRLGG